MFQPHLVDLESPGVAGIYIFLPLVLNLTSIIVQNCSSAQSNKLLLIFEQNFINTLYSPEVQVCTPVFLVALKKK